jgi:NAD(P)-dependent dehydrogenase (short-subunit alcohol dehydrogenase family)
MSLKGRVALVAGGTRGAGRGIAVELGAAGATVYVSGRTTRDQQSECARPETIEETAELVSASGGNGIAVKADHLVADEVEQLVDRIRAVVAIGEWGEDAGSWDRIAFPLRLRAAETEYQVTIVDAGESPWQGVGLLGRMLDREEALGHERLAEVFHVTDHMVVDDQPIRDHLDGSV